MYRHIITIYEPYLLVDCSLFSLGVYVFSGTRKLLTALRRPFRHIFMTRRDVFEIPFQSLSFIRLIRTLNEPFSMFLVIFPRTRKNRKKNSNTFGALVFIKIDFGFFF